MTEYTMRFVVPLRRLFPVWRYGVLHIGKGWYPDWYEDRAFATREEADAFVEQAA